MNDVKASVAAVCSVLAAACSASTGGGTASTTATSTANPSVKNLVYLTEVADGTPSFTRGEGIIAGKRYPHSFVYSCDEGCLPTSQAGQAAQPNMSFTVPPGFDRLEFVVGLTDSSTDTDRAAGVSVWARPNLTKLFESKDVTVGVVAPVSVPVSAGAKIGIDGWGLKGNEALCICDAKLVASS